MLPNISKIPEIDKIIENLSLFGDHFYLVQVNPPRGADPEKLKEKFKKYKKPVQVSKSVSSALQTIKGFSSPNDLVCITGSIFTVAEAKKYFQYEKSFTNPGNSPHSGK